jgi:signal peptidase I
VENLKQKGAFIWDLVKFCLISLAIVIPIRIFIAQPFIVSGKSMYPTFDNGQYLIVDELTYRFESPKRGDVIIFHFPGNTKEYFIKRIIGLPNETVEITGGKVKVTNAENPKGIILDEPYIDEALHDIPAKVLAPDEYFVMGDNRGASYDSRSWGPLNEKYIVGRALIRLVPLGEAGFFPGGHTF